MRAPLKTGLGLLTATALLLSAAGVNRHLISTRMENANTRAHDMSENLDAPHANPMPPSVALTTVFLGGFRGLIADGLWVRSSILQEQGRYFELVQLADWITALEPQFPQVWSFQAWNMAYNVSILMPDAPSGWRWVENGLELLRDRALPATGQAPEICLEIGLLFQYKIGGDTDERADYFKQRWVEQMRPFIAEDGTFLPAEAESLATTLKMNVSTMQAVESGYGRLDWRVPRSHAVYWAMMGLQQKPGPATAVLCRRMIYQSMASLFESGLLTEDRNSGILVFSTNFNLLPGVIDAFENALPNDPAAAEGFVNFLSRTIRLLMFYQHRAEAESLFIMLHQRFPTPATEMGFEAFIRHRQTFLPTIINTNPGHP